MKRLFLILSLFLLTFPLIRAEKVLIGSLYYNLNDTDMTAEMTYKSIAMPGSNYEITGHFIVPSQVSYNGQNYTVTSIGHHTFWWCYNIESIEIPATVTSIGSCAFQGCEKLSSINLPENIKEIEGNVFSECKSLAQITIPSLVTSIGESAFYYCLALTSIEIPSSVTSIGQMAFWSCSLRKIICKSETPPACEAYYNYLPSGQYDYSHAFYCFEEISEDTYSTCTLYIPEGEEALESYKTTEPWSRFINIVQVNFEDIEDDVEETPSTGLMEILNSDDLNVGSYDVYNLQGVVVKRNASQEELHSLSKGIYIYNGKKILIK